MLLLAPLSGQTRIDLGRQGKSINFSGAGATKPFQTGTTLPAACTAGDTFFKTDASPSKSLHTCSQAGVWAQVGDDGIPAAASATNNILSTDGISINWRALGGDISGPPDTAQVQGLQGRGVAPDAPTSGQVLSWNSSLNRWEPAAPELAGQDNFKVAFTGQSSATIAGATHGLKSANLISACYVGSAPLVAVSGYQMLVDPDNFAVIITFPAAFTGTCVLNASGGGTGSAAYTLQAATAALRGGVRVGAGLLMTGDVLSATGGGGGAVSAGTGIAVAGSAVSVDTAVVPTFLTASSTLDFTSIGANSCSIRTFSFPGAATGDSVIGGWPADMSTGIIPRILISATNLVQIQLCNVTSGAIDPPARTYGATILRSF